jgi:hypothetical protein
MSDLEFLGNVKMTRLTSLEEDIKLSQQQFRQDEADREQRRRGITKPTPETVYESLEGDCVVGTKDTLEDLIRTKKVMPASMLEIEKEAQELAQAQFESAVLDEQSHRKTKKPNGLVPSKPIYKRERLDE